MASDPRDPKQPEQTPDVRLEEVRQSDLSESRVNEDFLEWLKTKGMNYLLVALAALVGFLWWVRFQEGRDEKRDTAWVQYANAANATAGPELLEQVAATPAVAEVDGIASLARINAAERYLQAVLAGRQLRSEMVTDAADAEPAPLDEATRATYLDRADTLYAAVVTADDGSDGMMIHAWTALNGRASVAEARADGEAAATLYEQAAARVEGWYPELAARSRAFAETAGRFSDPVTLPPASEIRTANATAPRPRPVSGDPVLEAIIDPAAADDAATDEADAGS
ncbi:MAG: hypothetical protein ACYTEV_11840 [Planctomycetota bacterium]|jgi:hypothetical protein